MVSLPPPEQLQVYLDDQVSVNVSDQVIFRTGQDGLHQWEAGIVLARFVLFNAQLFNGRRVLELGSGTGLAGITASLIGAESTLSDYNTDVLENIGRSVELSGARVHTTRLDWTDPTSYLSEQFDCIIGSDLVYQGAPLDSLAHTINAHLIPGGLMFLIMPVKRSATPAFISCMSGFTHEELILDPDIYMKSPMRPEELGYKKFPELRLHSFKVHKFTKQ